MRRAILITLVCLVPAASAHAHAEVMSTSPPAGRTVAPPTAVRVHFDDVVQLPPRAIRITAAQGRSVPVRVSQPDSKTLVASLPRGLAAGRYDVRWRIVADDGHIESGRFHFAIRAGAKRTTDSAPLPSNRSSTSRAAVVLTLLLSLITIAAIGAALVRLRRERAVR